MDILGNIYVMFLKKNIFAKKNAIIMIYLYKLIMKMPNATNFVYFLLTTMENVYVSTHIIILVISIVVFWENQKDVMKNAH